MVLPEEQARLYRPRPELLPAAHVPSLPHYERLYQRSVEEPHGERRRQEPRACPLPPGKGRGGAGRAGERLPQGSGGRRERWGRSEPPKVGCRSRPSRS